MTETDIELIEGLRKQSPKAQQQMLDRYGRDVFAQVARLVPGIENAEEVYQDVFVKVFKNIDRYDEGKVKLESKVMTIEAGMETIKATYKYLKPAYETRNFSVMNKTIAHIAKQNETLDANFQDLIKTLKQSPEIPQKERLEVISGGYKEILKFYTEQNQGFTEITKELGYLPKEMQKAQKVINKLIEKNMNEMSKMITEIR